MKKIEFFDKITNESIGTIKYNQRNIQTLSKALKEARQINKNIFARVINEAVHRGANGKKFWVPKEQEKIGVPKLPDDAPEGFIDGYDYWYNETDDEQFPDIVRESVYNELVIGILPQKRDGRGRWADDNHTKYKASDVLPEEGTNNIKIIMPSEEREAKARQVAAKYNLDVVKVPYKDERRKYIKHALVIVIPDDIAYMNTEDYLNSLA